MDMFYFKRFINSKSWQINETHR